MTVLPVNPVPGHWSVAGTRRAGTQTEVVRGRTFNCRPAHPVLAGVGGKARPKKIWKYLSIRFRGWVRVSRLSTRGKKNWDDPRSFSRSRPHLPGLDSHRRCTAEVTRPPSSEDPGGSVSGLSTLLHPVVCATRPGPCRSPGATEGRRNRLPRVTPDAPPAD